MGIWPGHRGYNPTLYEKCHGILKDHRESGPRFNVSSEGRFTAKMPTIIMIACIQQSALRFCETHDRLLFVPTHLLGITNSRCTLM